MYLRVSQTVFNQGEVGTYMSNRTTNKLYNSSALVVENFLVIPHGPVSRRSGFKFVDDLHLLDFTPIFFGITETSTITCTVTVT